MNAFKWNVADQFLSQALGFLVNIIMARLLAPQDFGLFAVPMVILIFARTLQDGGTTNIIFKEKNPSTNLLSNIYGFTTILTIAISFFIFFLLAPVIAWWTNLPETCLITKYLSIGFLLSVPMLFHESIFKKKMDFKSLFQINIVATLFSGITGIILAYLNLGVWSLVIKQMLFLFITSLLLVIKLNWKKGMKFNIHEIWAHRQFTLPLLADQTISFAVRNVDSLLVGRFIGATALGIYDRAYKFLTLPIQQLGGAFSRVMLPSMSNMVDNEKTQKMFLTICSVVSLILFPMMVGLSLLSREFVEIVLTKKWISLIPLLQIFSILACFQTISTLASNLFLIGGQTTQMLKFSLLTKPVYLLIYMITTIYYKDIYLLAVWYSIASILSSLPYWHLACKAIDLKIINLLTTLLPQVIAAVCMGIVIYLSKYLLSEVSTFNFSLLISIGVFTYFFIIHFTNNHAYQSAKSFVYKN